MTRAKMLVQLVREGSWRRDRHAQLLWEDGSLLSILRSHAAELVELDECALWQLDWAYWWQAALVTGRAHESIALERFAEAVNGRHPMGPAPWPEDGSEP